MVRCEVVGEGIDEVFGLTKRSKSLWVTTGGKSLEVRMCLMRLMLVLWYLGSDKERHL